MVIGNWHGLKTCCDAPMRWHRRKNKDSMSNPIPNITVPVDLTNPGQFFACCGLLELADRLWPGVEGWFECAKPQCNFQIAASTGANLRSLLTNVTSLQFDIDTIDGKGSNEDDEDGALFVPIFIESPVKLTLDWWLDKSIKTWAGSMKERRILKAMLSAINPETSDPLNDAKAVFDPLSTSKSGKRNSKPKKREPFYFDCRRGSNAHPLDSGFSPDSQSMESNCFPAVEAMCFIGLQRARPAPDDIPNRSSYTAWANPLPINVIAPVVCGIIPVCSSLAFRFDNFYRTDQKKHKSYSRAIRERSRNARNQNRQI
jgi:CRISPR-associated protein Csb3